MPRDGRLYMTFPIDFDEHPKVVPLSDAAFRAFVSMNGYSRRHNLDGRIPVSVARSRWKPRALAELVASHPERPLVLLDGGVYVLRSYSEHQFTTADLEDLRSKRAAAGAKGGAAKAAARAKQAAGKPVANATANAGQTSTRDQSSEDNQDLTIHPQSHSGPAQDDVDIDPVLAAVVAAVGEHGVTVHPLAAPSVIGFIDSRRRRGAAPPRFPAKYYTDSIDRSWPEVEKFIHQEGIAS